MISKWTDHLKSDEEKKRFEKQILNSRPVLDRLVEMLRDDIRSKDHAELDTKNYDTPGWAYLQAHRNGYRAHEALVENITNLDRRITT